MNGFTAAARYEWTMQIRRSGLWITSTLLTAFTFVVGGFQHAFDTKDPTVATVRMALACVVALPIGFAFIVSDRAVRDRQLHLDELLDATPAGGFARLLGKYAGSCAAAAGPIAALFLGGALWYAVTHRSPSTLLWGLAVFATVILPGLAMIGAVAVCAPLAVPPAVVRILIVGFWLWSSWLVPPKAVYGLGETVLSPSGGYPIQVFFHYRGTHAAAPAWAGPVPGAALNWLRPAPTPATAVLSIACLLAVAFTVLVITAGRSLPGPPARRSRLRRNGFTDKKPAWASGQKGAAFDGTASQTRSLPGPPARKAPPSAERLRRQT
jgi:ABC-2 type transport system permease protein